jgi:hypothetical protein
VKAVFLHGTPNPLQVFPPYQYIDIIRRAHGTRVYLRDPNSNCVPAYDGKRHSRRFKDRNRTSQSLFYPLHGLPDSLPKLFANE